jgi:divalent metal cation (Fe/Co/Zn/Cd) transporter
LTVEILGNATAKLEKTSNALSFVVAAEGLTLLKLAVGILTKSPGILAEATHSAIDLLDALVTSFAGGYMIILDCSNE